MIFNDHCVYCGILMNDVMNHPQGRSVEHMIPNVSVSITRNNGEGDFYACRKCNCEKSRSDEIIGLICRMVGENQDGSHEAILKFKKALDRRDALFTRAFNSIKITPLGPTISIPLSGKELYQYGIWLAKGMYFMNRNTVLKNPERVYIEFISHIEVNGIKMMYESQRGSIAFDDLSKNIAIPNINGESFIIAGDELDKMFICLNRVIMFHIRILENTRSNVTLCNKARRSLYSFYKENRPLLIN